MNVLAWTGEKPTQLGWYYWRHAEGYPQQKLEVIGIAKGDRGLSIFAKEQIGTVRDGQWYGPILHTTTEE